MFSYRAELHHFQEIAHPISQVPWPCRKKSLSEKRQSHRLTTKEHKRISSIVTAVAPRSLKESPMRYRLIPFKSFFAVTSLSLTFCRALPAATQKAEAELLQMLEQARVFTKCTGYKEGFTNWIAKFDMQINAWGNSGDTGGDGSRGGSQVVQTPSPPARPQSCQDYERVIRAQLQNVSGLFEDFNIKLGNREPIAVTRPIVCEALDASTKFSAISKEANERLDCQIRSRRHRGTATEERIICSQWRQDQQRQGSGSR